MDLLSNAALMVSSGSETEESRDAALPVAVSDESETNNHPSDVNVNGVEEVPSETNPLVTLASHSDEVLNALLNGGALSTYLKSIPPARNAGGISYVMNRVVKALMGLFPEFFRDKTGFESFSTFNNLPADAKIQVYTLVSSLNKEDVGFDVTLKAIQNKLSTIPAIVAAVADSNNGSVIMNRIALIAMMLIHPQTQLDVNRYYEKFGKADRHHILTEGVIAKSNEYLQVLLQWCDMLAGQLTNPFTDEYPILRIINPSLGRVQNVDQLRKGMTEIRSTYSSLKCKLETSGRNESGEILDTTALKFCRDGNRTTPLSK